jgi:lipoprotein-anchoring transpeptidase ErfK/SrfK
VIAALVAALALTATSACSRGEEVAQVPTSVTGTGLMSKTEEMLPLTGGSDTAPPPTQPVDDFSTVPTVTVGGPVTTRPVTFVEMPGPPFVTVTPKAPGELAVLDGPGGRQIRTLPNPRLINNDPNAAVPLVLLVKSETDEHFEVLLPVRPNGSTGFVRKADVDLATHDYRIEVRLSAFNLKVLRGDEVVLDAPIAVASDNTPTPGGLYYTTELIRSTKPVYGNYAYGLSGFSDVLTSFNGGPGQLGIHGTNAPSSIGRKVSNGCIRMRNEDIDSLVPILPLGVPVAIYT